MATIKKVGIPDLAALKKTTSIGLSVDPQGIPQIVVRQISSAEFKKALTRLSTDVAFREKAVKDPTLIIKEYQLTLSQLTALRQSAVLSGAAFANIDKFRTVVGDAAADVNVSCCSCCCCCCGETGASLTLGA